MTQQIKLLKFVKSLPRFGLYCSNQQWNLIKEHVSLEFLEPETQDHFRKPEWRDLFPDERADLLEAECFYLMGASRKGRFRDFLCQNLFQKFTIGDYVGGVICSELFGTQQARDPTGVSLLRFLAGNIDEWRREGLLIEHSLLTRKENPIFRVPFKNVRDKTCIGLYVTRSWWNHETSSSVIRKELLQNTLESLTP
jgi:hypothetical protein